MAELEKHILYILVYVILAAVLIVGLHGNVLVIYVLHHRVSRIRKVVNLYMVNLAVANSCFLVGIVFFFSTLVYSEYHPYAVHMCWLRTIVDYVLPFTIGAFLAVLNLDKVLEICQPTLAKQLRTVNGSTVVSFLIWLASALISTPTFLYTDVATNAKNVLVCVDSWKSSDRTIYTGYWFMVGFAIPVPLCAVINVFTIALGRRQQDPEERPERESTRDVRIALILLLLHIFCWLPYWAFHFSQSNEIFQQNIAPVVNHVLWIITKCLTYVNSATSPILFAVMSKDFKKNCIEVCSCCTVPQKPNNTGGGTSSCSSSMRRYDQQEGKPSENQTDKFELCSLKSNSDRPNQPTSPREVVT